MRRASEWLTIDSTIIGGQRIRIRPEDGTLHGQTPSSAVEGDGLHVVIQHRNNIIAHAPFPDGKREIRLLVFFYFVVAPGDWNLCDNVVVTKAHRISVQSLNGSVLWIVGRCSLVIGVVSCCLLLCFLALDEGASVDFGHKCEPFLCVDVDCHGDCMCL